MLLGQMMNWAIALWPHVTSVLVLIVTLLAGAHASLRKRDVRSAIGWVGLIVLVPGIGAILYVLLGINRIRRRAVRVRRAIPRYHLPVHVRPAEPTDVSALVGRHDLGELVRLVGEVTTRPLLPGNRVRALRDGDEAFPAMIEAIDGARRSIALATYIFDNDRAGRRFVESLERATLRGVEVRVLVDAAGARYSSPPIDLSLRRRGVPVARFLRAFMPWRMPYFNLRNHRKILVVDGKLGFTGGMNIRHGCMLQEHPERPIADLHFRLEGPVVAHLMEVFAEDWEFSTREALAGEHWFPELAAVGDTIARGIADGPDEDLDRLRWTLLGALGCARRSIQIVTPYFLPDEPLVTALNVAALRGVEVDVLLPQRGNLLPVQWAMWGELWKVLEYGCRVWLTPPPFDHTKLLIVDDAWTLVGSANWDPRSLRLNFELNVECYDPELARSMRGLVEHKRRSARRLHASELRALPLGKRLRNGAARLFTPYL
jgi:cardiolipin synthase A/B